MLAQKICDAIKLPYDIRGPSLHPILSIGIAIAPDHGVDADQLLKSADLALYGAKAEGPRHLSVLQGRDGCPHPGPPRARA